MKREQIIEIVHNEVPWLSEINQRNIADAILALDEQIEQKETEDERIFKAAIEKDKELGIVGEWKVPTTYQLGRIISELHSSNDPNARLLLDYITSKMP
jgi:hypothetical protein